MIRPTGEIYVRVASHPPFFDAAPFSKSAKNITITPWTTQKDFETSGITERLVWENCTTLYLHAWDELENRFDSYAVFVDEHLQKVYFALEPAEHQMASTEHDFYSRVDRVSEWNRQYLAGVLGPGPYHYDWGTAFEAWEVKTPAAFIMVKYKDVASA